MLPEYLKIFVVLKYSSLISSVFTHLSALYCLPLSVQKRREEFYLGICLCYLLTLILRAEFFVHSCYKTVCVLSLVRV
jgi:hypothetical protein